MFYVTGFVTHRNIRRSMCRLLRIQTLRVLRFATMGRGFRKIVLERIFDPFFRVEEARDALGGGSGLGLSIAKRAVQVHHGTIMAENALPGLRVKIMIPIFVASFKHR